MDERTAFVWKEPNTVPALAQPCRSRFRTQPTIRSCGRLSTGSSAGSMSSISLCSERSFAATGNRALLARRNGGPLWGEQPTIAGRLSMTLLRRFRTFAELRSNCEIRPWAGRTVMTQSNAWSGAESTTQSREAARWVRLPGRTQRQQRQVTRGGPPEP